MVDVVDVVDVVVVGVDEEHVCETLSYAHPFDARHSFGGADAHVSVSTLLLLLLLLVVGEHSPVVLSNEHVLEARPLQRQSRRLQL